MLSKLYFSLTSRETRRVVPLDGRLCIPFLVLLFVGASVFFLEETEPGLTVERSVERALRGRPGLWGNVSSTRPRPLNLGRPREDVHPAIAELIKHYPFQPVRNQRGDLVNVVLVRSPFRSRAQRKLHEKYKDELLFVGISSFEDYPQVPTNPYSSKFDPDEYVGLFPGFLHMVREPQKVFPSHVKTLLMSQSDFNLPGSERRRETKYDFTFSGSDQDVWNDCDGWSSYAKNWTLVKQSLEVMCAKGMTGVLVATKDKANKKACTIPASCKGKIEQTQFLDQGQFYEYVLQSKFLFLPQVHDASPRVSTQALALDKPVLMNWHIMGGWKYLTPETGEFFNDTSDLEASIDRLLAGVEQGKYHPRKWVTENYGNRVSGKRLKEWIEKEFPDRVVLPRGTSGLFPAGA